MKHENKRHEHDPYSLLEEIESDSESIARLLQACGSSRNFGPTEQLRFEKLMRHRRQLMIRLEGLRRNGRSNRMASGE